MCITGRLTTLGELKSGGITWIDLKNRVLSEKKNRIKYIILYHLYEFKVPREKILIQHKHIQTKQISKNESPVCTSDDKVSLTKKCNNSEKYNLIINKDKSAGAIISVYDKSSTY